MSGRPPLVLLHGVTNSARIWDDVVPLLPDFDLIVPTAAGHRGGAARNEHLTVARLVDEVEALLDGRGIEKAHVAGNSMGGWMAIELARRGRALSVCALSPGGCWAPGSDDKTHATSTIRRARLLARVAAPVAPLGLLSAPLRRHLLRDAALHGDRITAKQALAISRDLAACEGAPDLLATTECIELLDPLPCPVTVAWSEHDRILPKETHGATAQALLPGATYVVLEGVGHVPMIDDPRLCAETIRNAAG